MRRKRLLWQLYPSYLLITLVSLAAVTLYGSRALRHFHLEQTKVNLESRARLIQEEVRQRVLADDQDRVDRLCKDLGRRASTRITVVLLPSGRVLGDSEESPADMDRHHDREEIVQAVAEGSGSLVRFSHTYEQVMAYVAIPIEDDSGRIIGVVRTAVPLTAVDRELATIYWRMALGGLLVALLAAALSMFVSRRISRPLEEIKEGAERFAGGDLSHKLVAPSTREIAALAETMNLMAAELDQRIRTAVGERNERQAILSSMVEGVLAVDCGQRVLGLNRAATELFGADPEQVQRRNLQEIVRSPELQSFVSEVLGTGRSAAGQVTLYGEKERVLHVHGTVLRGADGQAIGGLMVLHDVTRTKKLENIRRDFVANVSHELKTPITSIKGYVETLLEGAKDRPEDAHRFLEIIANQTDRLNAIIDDLLALSRIEKEAEPVEFVVARDGIAVVVNPENPVDSLTLEQVRKIYVGAYDNWSRVGGPDEKIVVLSRESSSGTYVFFQEHVLQKKDYRQDARLMPATSAIVPSVSSDKWAIGYVGLGYAVEAAGKVKIVSVKADENAPAIAPSDETVTSGEYSIARPLHLYTPGKPEGLAKDFIDFCLSDEGQKIVRETGYVMVK